MAIDFVYNIDFKLNNELIHKEWLAKAVNLEGYSLQNIVYAFFDDEALKQLNARFLNHNIIQMSFLLTTRKITS